MRYIKLYENLDDGSNNRTTGLIYDGYPKIGDYVICEEHSGSEDYKTYKTLIEFEIRNIGKIVDFRNTTNLNDEFNGIDQKYNIFVQYNNIPDEIYDDFNYHNDIEYCRIFAENEIIHSSKNKKDLEHIIKAKKYNL